MWTSFYKFDADSGNGPFNDVTQSYDEKKRHYNNINNSNNNIWIALICYYLVKVGKNQQDLKAIL